VDNFFGEGMEDLKDEIHLLFVETVEDSAEWCEPSLEECLALGAQALSHRHHGPSSVGGVFTTFNDASVDELGDEERRGRYGNALLLGEFRHRRLAQHGDDGEGHEVSRGEVIVGPQCRDESSRGRLFPLDPANAEGVEEEGPCEVICCSQFLLFHNSFSLEAIPC